MRLGFTGESKRFRQWLRGRLNFEATTGPLQVLYTLGGRKEVPEKELPHLRGYRDSKPVRIGNAAYQQLQLDVYGEMFDAIYLSAKYGDTLSHKGWRTLGRSGGRRGPVGGTSARRLSSTSSGILMSFPAMIVRSRCVPGHISVLAFSAETSTVGILTTRCEAGCATVIRGQRWPASAWTG